MKKLLIALAALPAIAYSAEWEHGSHSNITEYVNVIQDDEHIFSYACFNTGTARYILRAPNQDAVAIDSLETLNSLVNWSVDGKTYPIDKKGYKGLSEAIMKGKQITLHYAGQSFDLTDNHAYARVTRPTFCIQ